MVLTRRTGGAGRALYEPFLSRLRDVGTPGLLLSGDRDEGPLLGGMRAQVLPPGRGWLVDRRGHGDWSSSPGCRRANSRPMAGSCRMAHTDARK